MNDNQNYNQYDNMRQRNSSMKAAVLAIMAGGFIVAFQNCGNNMNFNASDDLESMLADRQYDFAKVGDEENFPPLKLLFVVDNSGTMGINQINLSRAFDRMFAGENQTNLAPFNTSASVISTSQLVPQKTSSAFARLPNQSLGAFASMDATQFQAHRGSTLSGRIPGDLAGFQMVTTSDVDRTVTSILPAPVALFLPTGSGAREISLESKKPRGASVDAFAADFRQRLALLNPELSEIDSGTSRGVLDDVIDNESGLCALARTLGAKDSFFKPGDLASVVVVSDENDSDTAGRACLDALIDGKSGMSYLDGRCEEAQSTLRYRGAIANPTRAKCQVAFENGFNYKLDYKGPSTNVTYYTKSMTYDQLQTVVRYYTSRQKYDQLRTSVAYFTSKMSYDLIETPVTYYTKAPTYQIPQTLVRYYKEVESCVIRDGAKTNCTYAYPDYTVTLEGSWGNNCDAFVAGKLPSGALYAKAGYLPMCAAGAPVTRSGACDPTNTAILNCQQNYSSPTTIRLTGKVVSTCDTLVAGRLPGGALYTNPADAGYGPMCGNLISTPKDGACSATDPDKANCRTVYTAATTPATLNGVPGAMSCSDFSRGKLGAGAVYDTAGYLPSCSAATPVTGVIGACSTSNTNIANCTTEYLGPSSATLAGRPSASGCEATFRSSLPGAAVLGNSMYPVTCTDGPTVAGRTGNCTTTNTNIVNCRSVYSSPIVLNLDGAPTIDCAGFVTNRLPAGAVYSDAGYLPACAAGTPRDKSVTGTLPYSSYPAVAFNANAACDASVTNSIVTSRGLVVAASTTPACLVTALNKSMSTLESSTQDVTCATAAWRDVCDTSAGARRNCMATDIAAGEKYEPSTTTVTYNGSFTCASPCSSTSFCPTKPGTVGDNYYACDVTAATPAVRSTFLMQSETKPDICATGQQMVVTKGPYKTDVSTKSYVGGAGSEANTQNALIDFIETKSRSIFNQSLPIVSVFVRQSGDTLGVNGSIGTAYNQLVDRLGGKKRSVLSNATEYASALEDLSAVIRERVGHSLNFKNVPEGKKVRTVWLRRAGTPDWGAPVSPTLWSASGATVTLDQALDFSFGDEFKIEYW